MAANQNEDNLEIELAISDDRINPTIDKARSNLTRFVGEVNATKITIGQHLAVDFDGIEKRTNALRTNLQEIAKARISAGNIGIFTKEIVGAGERVRVLQKEIADTQKLLEKPRSPYFAELMQRDLKAATTELATLESKLDRVGKKTLLPPGSTTRALSGRGGNLVNGLTSAAGAALNATGSPINETELQAVSAVAEHLGITLPAVEAAIAGISSGFLLTGGAVAAAGIIAIQYSRNLREEAERRLKVETDLAVAYGKQQVAITKAFDDLQKARQYAALDRGFNKDLQGGGTDFLKERIDFLEKFQHASSPFRPKLDDLGQLIVNKGAVVTEDDPDFARRSRQLLQLDERFATESEKRLPPSKLDNYQNIQELDTKRRDLAANDRQNALNKSNAEISAQNFKLDEARLANHLSVTRATEIESISATTQQKNQFLQKQIADEKTYYDTIIKLAGNDSQTRVQYEQDKKRKIGLIESEIQINSLNADTQIAKSTESLKASIKNFVVGIKSEDNPLIKSVYDLQNVFEQTKKQFPNASDAVVKQLAELQRGSLTKQIGSQAFQNDQQALTYDQQARLLQATPDRLFAPFTRSLEKINKTADTFLAVSGLTRVINESSYYANQFDPRRPKSFEEANRTDRRADLSPTGIALGNAVSDISGLFGLDTGNTGIYGQGAIGQKILSLIPSKEILIQQLSHGTPEQQDRARYLFSAQSEAARVVKQAEFKRLQDVVEDQKTQQYAQLFGKEKLGAINNALLSGKITDDQAAQQKRNVFDALGNDLSPDLKRSKIDNLLKSRDLETKRNDELYNAIAGKGGLRDLVSQIFDAVTGKTDGIKGIETLIRVQDETTGKKVKGVEDNKRPSGKSTDDYYNRK